MPPKWGVTAYLASCHELGLAPPFDKCDGVALALAIEDERVPFFCAIAPKRVVFFMAEDRVRLRCHSDAVEAVERRAAVEPRRPDNLHPQGTARRRQGDNHLR